MQGAAAAAAFCACKETSRLGILPGEILHEEAPTKEALSRKTGEGDSKAAATASEREENPLSEALKAMNRDSGNKVLSDGGGCLNAEERESRRSKNPRFAIFCSGYCPKAPSFSEALERLGGRIRIPSLHVFGRLSNDQQVPADASLALRDCFETSSAVTLEHKNRGHYLPADKQSLSAYRKFLQSFD